MFRVLPLRSQCCRHEQVPTLMLILHICCLLAAHLNMSFGDHDGLNTIRALPRVRSWWSREPSFGHRTLVRGERAGY